MMDVSGDRSEVRSKKDGKEEAASDEEVSFSCRICSLSEKCHYFGRKPPFVRKQLEFKSDTFVMRDPFSPRESGRAHFLAIGGVCDACGRSVCVECSTFYFKRICDDCASSNLAEFPQEVGAKIQKKLDSRGS